MSEEKKEAPAEKKRPNYIKILIAAVCVLLFVFLFFVFFNSFYIDLIWFGEVGYTDVYLKELTTRAMIQAPIFFVLFIWISVYLRKLQKIYESSKKFKVIETGKSLKKRIVYLISAAAALIVSFIVTAEIWYKFLQFINSTPFGQADPIFGHDISFYVFRLPLFRTLITIAFITLITCAAASVVRAAVMHACSSGEFKEVKSTVKAFWNLIRVPLSIYAALMFVLLSVSTYFSRFEILTSDDGLFFGPSYTDVNVLSPFYIVIIAVCTICAVCVLILGIRQKIKPLVITLLAFMLINAGGTVYRIIVEAYVVSPNQFSKEEPYIAHNIEFTRLAYGLEDIETVEFNIDYALTAADIAANSTTVSNIPINDYMPTIDTYNSLQGMRPYYYFTDIDVDRYMLSGVYTQVFISARELDSGRLNVSAQNWINTHLKYTHGFGVAVSPVNKVTATGQPSLIVKDIPPKTDFDELAVKQPRIYFGEISQEYAVVNTLGGEFDYPSGSNNMENTYDGNAGIRMSLLNRLCFSVRYGTTKFLFSSDITSDSRILINRNVVDRVKKIAPFFIYDDDPYIVLDNGNLFWVLDAMTYTDKYPYSQPYDSTTGNNYIRNSIKVVVDAYNGDVKFYIVDESDAIVQSYKKIYPNLFTPAEEMSAELRKHLRYSETLFSIQANIFKSYHMTNPNVFYNKEDQWQIATQYYQASRTPAEVNPSYLVMKLPGKAKEEFILMLPYTPANKDNMVAWMAGLCDGEDYGKLVIYQFPKQSQVYGPMQIEQRIDQDTTIAPQLNLLAQQGSTILRGNMQTIPIENSILYVEAIYVQSGGGDQSLPEAKKVIACYEDKIVMADTLNEAIIKIFGEPASGTPPQTPSGPSQPAGNETLKEKAKRAQQAYSKAQEALKNADWAEYGRYMDELEKLLDELSAD